MSIPPALVEPVPITKSIEVHKAPSPFLRCLETVVYVLALNMRGEESPLGATLVHGNPFILVSSSG